MLVINVSRFDELIVIALGVSTPASATCGPNFLLSRLKSSLYFFVRIS